MSKSRKIAWTFGKRIAIVVFILLAIMVAIVEYAENAKEPLRLGLQDYLTRIANENPAEITVLEKSELFPQIDFVARGILVRDKDDSQKALVMAEAAHVSMGFWGAFFGVADYRHFAVENVAIATGFLLPQKLTLNFIGISDPESATTPPYFMAEGRYNNRDLLATAEMRREGTGTKVHYDFTGEFPVTFKLGSTEANARFIRNLTRIEFAQIVLASGGRKAVVATKDVSFKPLNIPLSGEMGGFPFAAKIIQGEEGVYLVEITPGSDDPQFLKELGVFTQSIMEDFGVDSSDGQIKVEILPPVVAQQGASEIKE